MQHSDMSSRHATAQPLPAAQETAPEVEALYFLGPQNQDNTEFDFAPLSPQFLSNIDDRGCSKALLPRRTLLPENFSWRSPSGAQRIPMLLSEFCAYKAALAYGAKDKISDKLGVATDFHPFDTAGGVTDTQGFGCCYDGIVFISMRGTEGLKNADWRVNFSDSFTDEIDDKDAKKIAKLVRRFAVDENWSQCKKDAYKKELLALVGKLKNRPGLHLGFAMAWEEVSGQVIAYLNDIQRIYGSVPPIVLTGHSLGGALATVGAYDLRSRGYSIAAVVTFGAPCVGNKEFAASYSDDKTGGYSLQDRTVRFVAAGDSVPKIMRRWYYRLANLGLGEFDEVGSFLRFTGAPKLSLEDISSAIKKELERRAKAEEEAKKAGAKASQPAKVGGKGGIVSLVLGPILIVAGLMFTSPTLSFGGGEVAQIKAGQSQSAPLMKLAQAEAPAPSPEATSPAEGEPAPGSDVKDIGIFVAIFATIVTLIVILSRLQSHSVANRYALYLSTLSYQMIRSFRASEPAPFESRLAAANGDLERYLRFIRGDTQEQSAVAEFLMVAKLPVRLVKGIELGVFKAANEKTNIF